MSELSWDDVVEAPDELDDGTAEVCPYPQVEAKKAIAGLAPGDVLVQKTDHVPSSENVPKAVGDDATAKVWESGDGYCTSLRKE